MYCNKLINIVQDEKSQDYVIDMNLVEKLDKFIKEKTTLKEREKLNPVRFSIEMSVSQESSLMIFILGIKTGLFKPRNYYSCSCEEHFEIENIKVSTQCPSCNKNINPSIDRNRIFLYFKLTESPRRCEWEINKPIYPLDFLEEVYKENFTVADLDNITKRGEYDSLIGLRGNHENDMLEFLKEELD